MELNISSAIFKILLIVGGVYFAAGLIMALIPPRKINWFYGYRTNSSMKSQARWDFAQNYSARQLVRWGLILVAVSLIGLIIELDKIIELIISIVFIAISIFYLFRQTEMAIKREFG